MNCFNNSSKFPSRAVYVTHQAETQNRNDSGKPNCRQIEARISAARMSDVWSLTHSWCFPLRTAFQMDYPGQPQAKVGREAVLSCGGLCCELKTLRAAVSYCWSDNCSTVYSLSATHTSCIWVTALLRVCLVTTQNFRWWRILHPSARAACLLNLSTD